MTKLENDFGFSIVDEKDVAPINTADKAIKVHDLIHPLLMNLKKNPERDIIKWPGKARVKTIEDILYQINNIMGE